MGFTLLAIVEGVVGAWVLSTQTGKSFNDYEDLMLGVGNHLDLWAQWWSTPIIGVDFGVIRGKQDPNCGLEFEYRINNPELTDGLGLRIGNKELVLEAVGLGDSVSVVNSEYVIYDVAGKIVDQGIIGENGFIRKTDGITNRILFVQINSGINVRKFKLYIID